MPERRRERVIESKWVFDNFGIKPENNKDLEEKLTDRLIFLRDVIEPFIFGTDNYTSWVETKMLSKREKSELFKVFKVLQHLIWEARIVGITNKGFPEWVREFKTEWEKIKSGLEPMFKKISIGWKKYKGREENIRKAYGVG